MRRPKGYKEPTKMYILKTDMGNMQTVPVPKDLDNWIEVDYDSEISYVGMEYVEATGGFIKNQARILKGNLSSRKLAYTKEADPLYMEWQFDQTPKSEQLWRDKVNEIKLRYPL